MDSITEATDVRSKMRLSRVKKRILFLTCESALGLPEMLVVTFKTEKRGVVGDISIVVRFSYL